MKILIALLSIFIAVSTQAMLLTEKEVAHYLNGKTFESNEVLLEGISRTSHKVQLIFAGNTAKIQRVFSDKSYKSAWLQENEIQTHDLGSPFQEDTFLEYLSYPGNSLGLSLESIYAAQKSYQQEQLDSNTPDFSMSAKYKVARDWQGNLTIDLEANCSGIGLHKYWLDFYENFPKIVLSKDNEKVAQIEWRGRSTPLHTFVQLEQ